LSRYHDFDMALAEEKREPVTFKWGGVEYNLPSEMPAIVMIRAERLKSEYGDQSRIPDKEWCDGVFGKLMGTEQYDKLLESGITMEQLIDVQTWVLSQYGPELPNLGASENGAKVNQEPE
jgi:hypothetical protein